MEFASLAADKGLEFEIEACEDAVQSDPSLVRIEVLDTGVGIPADQLSYIYDEFYQVGVPANSSRDGYGLGLTIVPRLVNLLTLRLDVRSEVGRGSAFSLVLPAGAGHGDAPFPAFPPGPRG